MVISTPSEIIKYILLKDNHFELNSELFVKSEVTELSAGVKKNLKAMASCLLKIVPSALCLDKTLPIRL